MPVMTYIVYLGKVFFEEMSFELNDEEKVAINEWSYREYSG